MAELNPLPESLPQFTKKRGKEEGRKKDAIQRRLPGVRDTSAKQTEISERPVQALRKYNVVKVLFQTKWYIMYITLHLQRWKVYEYKH